MTSLFLMAPAFFKLRHLHGKYRKIRHVTPIHPNFTKRLVTVSIGLISLWCEPEVICFVQTWDMTSFQMFPPCMRIKKVAHHSEKKTLYLVKST